MPRVLCCGLACVGLTVLSRPRRFHVAGITVGSVDRVTYLRVKNKINIKHVTINSNRAARCKTGTGGASTIIDEIAVEMQTKHGILGALTCNGVSVLSKFNVLSKAKGDVKVVTINGNDKGIAVGSAKEASSVVTESGGTIEAVRINHVTKVRRVPARPGRWQPSGFTTTPSPHAHAGAVHSHGAVVGRGAGTTVCVELSERCAAAPHHGNAQSLRCALVGVRLAKLGGVGPGRQGRWCLEDRLWLAHDHRNNQRGRRLVRQRVCQRERRLQVPHWRCHPKQAQG